MPKIIRRATMNKLKGYLESLGMSSSSTTSQQAPAAGKLDELGCEDALDAASFSFCKTSIYGFPAEPSCFAYDPVQRIFAIGTKTGRIRVFGQPGADCCLVHPASNEVSVTSSPDMSGGSNQTSSTSAAVIQILFVVNDGALISLCADSKLHYWNLKEKQPCIRNTIQFQREIPSFCFQPIQSKWLFVGSSQGNVHFVNVESFTLSGYIIYWNKAVGPTMVSKHPGAVVQLIDSPIDPNKLLIGFESGLIVLWDLKSKNTECKFAVQEGLHSLSWHSDGRYFMSSHTDGSLITWDVKTPAKPASIEQPHAIQKNGSSSNSKEYFMPIPKIEWKTAPESEQFVLFSGGTPISRSSRSTSTLSIMRGKNLNLLDLQAEIIDFCTLCTSPFANEAQNPLAVAVLLENDLIIFDLQTGGYPPFENPYSMDIHDSEVTFNGFVVDAAPDIVPCLYKAGMRQRQNAFSPKEWPVKGGTPGQSLCSYSQLIITGHRNGLVKFWDASGIQLQILYLLNVSKLFQTASEVRRRLNRVNSNARPGQPIEPIGDVPVSESKPETTATTPESAPQATAPEQTSNEGQQEEATKQEEVPPSPPAQPPIASTASSVEQPAGLGSLINAGVFAITQAKLSENGQLLLVGGVGFAVLYRLNESAADTSLSIVEARFSYQPTSSPPASVSSTSGAVTSDAEGLPTTPRPSTSNDGGSSQSAGPQGCLLRQGNRRWNAGYQPDMAVVIGWMGNASASDVPAVPPAVTCLDLQQSTEVLFVGTNCGVVVVDCVQKACVMKLTTPELYACIDPATLKCVLKKAQKEQRAAANAEGGSDDETDVVPPFNSKSANQAVPSSSTTSSCNSQSVISPMSTNPNQSMASLDGGSSGAATAASSSNDSKQAKSKSSKVADASSKLMLNVTLPANLSLKMSELRNSSTDVDSAVGTGRDSPDIFVSTPTSSAPTITQNPQNQQVSTADTITCALFTESFPNKVKPDSKQTQQLQPVPTLWMGSYSGAVFIAAISLPDQSERASSPVIVSVSQTVYQMSGPVLAIDILPMSDFISTKPHAAVVPDPPAQQPKLKYKQSAPGGGLPVFPAGTFPDSQTLQQQQAACQLGVMVSRDQLVTLLLPAQTVASRARPSAPIEGEPRRQFVRAAVVRPKEGHTTHCVACLASDGQVSFFSLPRLRPLFDVDQFCDGSVSLRSLNTFRFSHYGHAIFFSSPSEIAKLSFWADTNDKLELTQGTVYTEQLMPERPKQSFLKTLFASGAGASAMAEREELFGDPNLKPSVNVARQLGPPGNRLQQLQAEVSSSTSSANSPYRQMIEGAKERGEKLSDLDEKTQRMMLGASDFAKNAAAMVEREKNKKWYNPFS